MQASPKEKIKWIRHFSGVTTLLFGIIVLIVIVLDRESSLFTAGIIAITMILLGLLNLFPSPVIVKVIGACIAIFVGAFFLGYNLVRLILG